MADYYSILKKTIDGLPKNTPELRNAVYQKARTAIGNQLRGMNPPPAEEAIGAQLQLLEDAILVVDMEYSGTAANPPVEPEQPTAEPVQQPAPVAETPPLVPPAEPVQPADAPIEPVQQPTEPPPPPAQTPPPQDPSPAVEPIAPTITPAHALDKAVEPPTVGMVPPPQPSVPAASAGVAVATPDPAARASLEHQGSDPSSLVVDDQLESFGSKKKKGILGKLIAGLVVLGILVGGGYALWLNRDSLQPIIATLFSSDEPVENATDEGNTPSVSENEQAIDDDTAAQASKESVKLGADGNDTEVSPLDSNNQPRVVGGDDEEQSAEQAQGTDNGSAAESELALPIGEVAYLYEEGSAGAGATRTNAAIAWESKQEVLADGLAPEPVIYGNMQVPEKDLSVDIEIKRNVDEALSASHIIEVKFVVPEGFSGSSIDNIARFVMKSSEEARGEPLVAVPVKVSDGFFLIALDNLQQAVDVNTRLMLNSSWIDIPISYATGKRALITLEKGGTGTQIFQEAFSDWQNR